MSGKGRVKHRACMKEKLFAVGLEGRMLQCTKSAIEAGETNMHNIVFDMGNVLTKYSLTDYIWNYVDNETEFGLVKDQICSSVEWIRMDRGTMTDDEAIASINSRMPEKMWELTERFIREFRMEQEQNPPMEALLAELKQQGYRLYLMSNTSHRFRQFSKNIPSITYMDGIWISCESGYLKPEREAYLDFFEKMKLEPEDCFFVDDSPANIEAAMRLGMRGCVYHQDMDELRNNLREAIGA